MFQVSSVGQLLKIQEQLAAEMQNEMKTLSDSRDEYKTACEKKSEELRHLEEELKAEQRRTEEVEKLFREAEAQMSSVEKQKAELDNVVREMKKQAEVKYGSLHLLNCCLNINIQLNVNLVLFHCSDAP